MLAAVEPVGEVGHVFTRTPSPGHDHWLPFLCGQDEGFSREWFQIQVGKDKVSEPVVDQNLFVWQTLALGFEHVIVHPTILVCACARNGQTNRRTWTLKRGLDNVGEVTMAMALTRTT